jgi:hypothetical protein
MMGLARGSTPYDPTYSGSRSNGSQTRKKGTGSRPCLNLSHRRFGLRALCLSPFSVRDTSVIRCKMCNPEVFVVWAPPLNSFFKWWAVPTPLRNLKPKHNLTSNPHQLRNSYHKTNPISRSSPFVISNKTKVRSRPGYIHPGSRPPNRVFQGRVGGVETQSDESSSLALEIC